MRNHLLHFWPKPGPVEVSEWGHNLGNAGADSSSPKLSCQQPAWACRSAELSPCRHPEVGNKEHIVSVLPCKNKMLLILAKCQVSQVTCWLYEVGLSYRKVDWLTDWLPDLQVYMRKRLLNSRCSACQTGCVYKGPNSKILPKYTWWFHTIISFLVQSCTFSKEYKAFNWGSEILRGWHQGWLQEQAPLTTQENQSEIIFLMFFLIVWLSSSPIS